MTLRESITRSLNSVAVRVSEKVGRCKVIRVARRLGIKSKLRAHPSIALGAAEVTMLELTGAYATLGDTDTALHYLQESINREFGFPGSIRQDPHLNRR